MSEADKKSRKGTQDSRIFQGQLE